MAEYLRLRSQEGIHHDVLRDISTSISMACVEASDGQHQPGKSFIVTSFMEGERRHRPVRRKDTGEYSDVVGLYQEAWRYGPDSALALGHLKEKIVILLMADTASRPSDIARLYRIFDSWKYQIHFEEGGMRVRFFYTKEVVPGSSRDNSTSYYFSMWVPVRNTTPSEISTPECLRSFLEASSGPEFATVHIPELNADAQPLVYARKVKGVFQASSVDHISNIVKAALQRSKMKNMTCRSVRGASPSKVVQLFPDLLSEALKLGRCILQSAQTPPSSLKTNIQQILR